VQEISLSVVYRTVTTQYMSRDRRQWYLDVGNHSRVAGHVRSCCEGGDLTEVLDTEVGFVGSKIRAVWQAHGLALEDGHGVRTDSPFEGESGSTQQEWLIRIWAEERLVPRHLCADELAFVVDEGEECAIAVHPVYAMLNKRVERDVATRDWAGRRTLGDIEGE
jgi:hypothetical protein